MATLVRKIIKANCATGFYDDGVSINLNRVSTLPEDADCLVYPDWHGHSGVRVEKNSNSPVNFSIEYQDALIQSSQQQEQYLINHMTEEQINGY